MSDHPDQPLQELATAAQLDEALDEQQPPQMAKQDASDQRPDASEYHPDLDAQHHHSIASSLGDVHAVVAAAASAQQQQQQQQQQRDAARITSMGSEHHDTDDRSRIDPSIAAAAVAVQAQNRLASEDTSMQVDNLDADASMMTQDDGDTSMNATGTPKQKKERAKPKPRSKSATKITRFRKITSCLQCREKKQKCDRKKPICGNCRENPTEQPCHYVDERKRPESEDEEHAAGSFNGSPLVRKRKQADEDDFAGGSNIQNDHIFKRADFPRVQDRRQALFLQTRRDMVDKLVEVGMDKGRDFNTRVNAARAAAIADVLFESAITLPTADQVSSLLYTYKTQVEPFVNVVVIDINAARILSFLRWWHSKPTTMPADPPLVPLLLVVLALTMQAKRSSPEYEGHSLRDDAPLPGIECSDERTLLSVAGHCIDALQIACPSAWSSAFQAPIDLTKASLLRGIWHLNELNLQFAGTCFALTVRLAHAAGLHRDPEHWSGMRIEEAQARRNLWWNIVFFEVAHAHRIGQPPCLSHEGFDTRYPDDYEALSAMYQRAGLADPDPSRIILPEGTNALVPRVPSTQNFDYHWARFRIYHIFLRQSQQLFRFGVSSSPDPNLNHEYAKWRDDLPDKFQLHFERRKQGQVRPSPESLAQIAAQTFDSDIYDPQLTEELQDYQQGYNLEFMYHQCMITLHRPYIDEQGAWKPPESVQKSLEVCLHSAEALIDTVDDVLAVVPANCMYNLCAYFAFNAGLILAIHCKLDPSSQKHRPHIQRALLQLDLLSGMTRLRNVAEQASRYCSTLKQMLNGISGDMSAPKASTAADEDGKADNEASREATIMGALDPSLGSGETNTHTSADGGVDRIPAFLLPFVGLPADHNNLGPQPGSSFWSEALLDRPMFGVPVAYPIGYGQGTTNTGEQNGNSWLPEGAQTALETGSDVASRDTAAVAAAAAEAYEYYRQMGGKEPAQDTAQTNTPDRPMSFSQHYNHQHPSREQASSASYRSYVQNSLARTYDQQHSSASKTGEEGDDKLDGQNGVGLPDESALNAVAAAAAAAAAAGDNNDAQIQGNNLASLWAGWENYTQMLHNRQ